MSSAGVRRQSVCGPPACGPCQLAIRPGRIRSCASLAAVVLCAVLAGCGDADYGGENDEPPSYDVRVRLTSLEGGGEVGLVELNKLGEAERVEIIVGYLPAEATGRYDAHLHRGTCEEHGAIVRSLDDVVDGRSSTRVSIGLDDLLTEPYSVDVHPGGPGVRAPLACAGIVETEVGG